MSDEMPEQPKTQQLPAVDPIAEIKGLLVQGFKGVRADMDLMMGEITSHGNRLNELEAARQRASDRARAMQSSISSSDLNQDAKIADVIQKVKETHALATNAATKEDLKNATEKQTSAIVEGITAVSTVAEKSPTVRMLLLAFAGLVLLCLNFASNYVTARMAVQAPASKGLLP